MDGMDGRFGFFEKFLVITRITRRATRMVTPITIFFVVKKDVVGAGVGGGERGANASRSGEGDLDSRIRLDLRDCLEMDENFDDFFSSSESDIFFFFYLLRERINCKKI